MARYAFNVKQDSTKNAYKKPNNRLAASVNVALYMGDLFILDVI